MVFKNTHKLKVFRFPTVLMPVRCHNNILHTKKEWCTGPENIKRAGLAIALKTVPPERKYK